MSNNITPDELTAQLMDCCREYTDDVVQKVDAGIERIGAEAAEELRTTSPVYKGRNKDMIPGAYRRSWTHVVEKSRGTINVTVHAKGKHYRLTHLLENGHLTRDGTMRSKAIPHISIANENAQKKVNKLLEEI